MKKIRALFPKKDDELGGLARSIMKFKLLQPVYIYRINKKMKTMTRWEQYVFEKELMRPFLKTNFACKLVNLNIWLIAKAEYKTENEEEFQELKEKILQDPIIGGMEFCEFRKWLESIDSSIQDRGVLEREIDRLFSEQEN